MVAGQSLGDERGWILSKRRCEAVPVCECELLIVLVSKPLTLPVVYRQHTNLDTNQNTSRQHVYFNLRARYYIISISLFFIPGKTYWLLFSALVSLTLYPPCHVWVFCSFSVCPGHDIWPLCDPGQVCRWHAASAGRSDASEQAEQHVPGEASRARQ